MLDVNLIRENPEAVKKGLEKKMIDPSVVDNFLVLDKEWREETHNIEELQAELNKLSRDRKVDEAKKVKTKIKDLSVSFKTLDSERLRALNLIPNLPEDDAPAGSEENNVILRTYGKKPDFSFEPKDHLELGERLGVIDTKRAANTSGSRFGFLLGAGAKLEFALIQLAVDLLESRGFKLVVPPALVKEETMRAMGYFERGEEEIYKTQDDLYLIGTSEQVLGPMHAGENISASEMPLRYAGFSSCFRREAGTYGKDTRGIFRLHQFDKLEMLSIVDPEKSGEEHELFLSTQEELMKKLDLHYQVVNIAGEGLGDPAAKKYDIETWIPSQKKYRETHSTSNTTDYQTRRLRIKCQKSGTTDFAHMVNGTAFAIGRIIIAIIENYQTKEGTVMIPKALRKYMGVKEIK